jgi:rubrerythrin
MRESWPSLEDLTIQNLKSAEDGPSYEWDEMLEEYDDATDEEGEEAMDRLMRLTEEEKEKRKKEREERRKERRERNKGRKGLKKLALYGMDCEFEELRLVLEFVRLLFLPFFLSLRTLPR